MPVLVNVRVRWKPQDLNYEVFSSAEGKGLRFRTSERQLLKLIKDLQTKKGACQLLGNNGEKLLISGGLKTPQRAQLIEYLELVLEG